MALPNPTVRVGDREIGRVGLGTNRLTDNQPNREFLREAVAAGVGHIDTAHLYSSGDSERTIGATFGDEGERPFVATKAGYDTNKPEALRAQIEESFERLRTDTLDLLYLHRIKSDGSFAETLEILREFVDAGRVRNVGLSEVTIGEISEAQGTLPIAAVQNEYSLKERKHDEVIAFCELEEIAFVPFFPLRGDAPALGGIAERHGVTSNTVKIAWLLARSPLMVPIPGTLSITHLRENIAALEVELAEDEIEALSAGD